jgi:acyl dehydratase
MSNIRKKTIQGLKVGDNFTVVRAFSETDMLSFSEITRDYNPIHFDKRFSTVKNFNDRICHGLLVASIMTEIGGQIGWLASVMNFRFKRPVYFGDTITCTLTITEIDERNRAKAQAEYQNQDGIIVLQAELEGILPGSPEREVLTMMINEGDPTNKLLR